jgi:flagellar M-ring protein FliF
VNGFRQALDQTQGKLATLSFNQKVMLSVIALAALISVITFSTWLHRDVMAVLFTNLSPEDAQVALDELAKQNVKAELTNGGTTIMVPEPDVSRLRVDLAAKGVPSSGVVGFEIFDGQQYGLTEFLQDVNFKRALEGELTKTIEGLQGITSARIHLVLPKPSIFRKLASEPTASVVLGLGGGTRLSEHQISGIQSLVAGSVEGLTADKVTVIDQRGNVLSSSHGDDMYGQTEGQLAMKQQVETYLSDKAQTLLTGVLGDGRSLVRVDATLNFEKIDTERTTFDPDNPVIRSEERQENPGATGSEGGSSSVTNYEISQTVERIVGETGGIKSISVAVFVDGNYVPGEDGKPATYQPRGDQELEQLKRIVQTAVGLNSTRGDQIEVVNMQFQPQIEVEKPGGLTAPGGPLEMVGQYGGKGLLILLLVGMLLMFKKNLSQAMEAVFRPGGLTSGGPASPATGGAPGTPQERFEGLPDMTDQMIDDVREYASENPQRVAEVIQSWIHEPERSAGR